MVIKKEQKIPEKQFRYNNEIDMRSILQNAIRMQALYSGKRIKIIETSKSAN